MNSHISKHFKSYLPYFVGILITSLIVYYFGILAGIIVTIFFLIIPSFVFGYYHQRSSISVERLNNIQFHDVTTPVVTSVQPTHDELIALGFTLDSEFTLPPRFNLPFIKRMGGWIYIDQSKKTIATLNTQAQVIFTSYFSNGVEVATVHPIGTPVDSEKIKISVVETSVPAAFDYQRHYCHMLENDYGRPVSITNNDIIIQNSQHVSATYTQVINQNMFDSVRYNAIGAVGAVGSMMLVYIGTPIISPIMESHPLIGQYSTLIIIFTIILLLILSWFWLVYWYRKSTSAYSTIEARKAKKREAEGA